MSSPCRAERSRRPATWTCCSWTRPGTITLGNRQAVEFVPAPGVQNDDLADAAQLASLADETPEGRSIVVLAKEKYGLRGRDIHGTARHIHSVHRSNADERRQSRTAARSARAQPMPSSRSSSSGSAAVYPSKGRHRPSRKSPSRAARHWSSPKAPRIGVIHLKDIVKGGIKERFAELRRMGIKTVMITGDNPLTAAAIAAEAGVDDFLAQATPEAKLKMIREQQAGGRLVAMTGDGTNDAPALAQADVAVAMNPARKPPRKPATWSISIPIRRS